MTATNIRIMEESAENKTFERIVQGSVCINRSDRYPRLVRPVTTQKSSSELKLCATSLKPNSQMQL